MTRWAGLLAGLVVAAFIAGAVAAGGGTSEQVLVVTDDDGDELLVTPVADDAEVVVAYTHSVERTDVRDVYVVRDGKLVMTRMEFSSYGAGLPSTVPVTRSGDRYVYEPPEQEYDPLRISTGAVADHDLVVGDERYDLAERADGGNVEIRVETRFTFP